MYKTIKEVEDAVGRSASDVIVRAREILVIFSSGGRLASDNSLGASIIWHIKR